MNCQTIVGTGFVVTIYTCNVINFHLHEIQELFLAVNLHTIRKIHTLQQAVVIITCIKLHLIFCQSRKIFPLNENNILTF